MMYDLLRPVGWLLAKGFFFHKAYGVENIPDRGGCLFVSNHISLLDPVFLGVAVKKRRVHYMAKAEIFNHKLPAAFFRSMGAFPVKRGAKDVSAVKAAIEMLEKGENVGMFPQGKRVGEEKLSRYKTGFALIAAKSGCPIVPVYVTSKKQRVFLFRRVRVVFGKPVTAQELVGDTEDLQAMASRMMAITEELKQTL